MSSSSKRIRLSSPTFDDQVHNFSQEDIHAFDSLDPGLSQSMQDDDNPFHSESNDDPYATWFTSDTSNAFVGFTAAATAMPGFQRPSRQGETQSLFVPSAAALREAEERMRKWQEDDHPPTHKEPPSVQAASPPRATFSSAKDALRSPDTPTPASSSRSAHGELTSARSHGTLQNFAGKHRAIPFKSPLVGKTSHHPTSTPSVSSPLRVHQSSVTAPASQATTAVLPLRPSSLANHAASQRPLGFTPRRGRATAKPKFVTPFKAGVKHAPPSTFDPEHSRHPIAPSSPNMVVNRIYPPSIPPSPRPSKQNNVQRVFDLTPPPGRRTLATSALRPQAYTARQLEDMGINFRQLSQVDLRVAPFYVFTTRSYFPPDPLHASSPPVLDRSAVLQELHAKGCTLAKQAWVDNHWPLVLWKLAGMALLDPMSENDPFKKRWCWPEVIRQFMYRYERDLNGSSRPPFRLITTRDASAESPMILCISDIIWPAGGSRDAVTPAQALPELEVTDGWYRLRARIDAPLARAVKKGKIKIGRKIAAVGTKLLAERKEGCEILEAYNSNVLLLTGNSTHMAPWHAKLGFHRGPMVATLSSLTADGGNVAVMMLMVLKAYPVAYIEFIQDASGQKERVGPHDAKEELKLATQWKTKRETHASELWSEYETRRDRLLDYGERLEQRAGSRFKPGHDDSPPDTIYDLYDTLQDDVEAAKSIISTISLEDAGWLARHIHEKIVQERDGASGEIDLELESTCPARDVKAFCVVVVKDTQTYKYPSTRTAQVTVWDVPGVSVLEGCAQSPFVPGQRYFVTNLVPTQASAWMDGPEGEVYLTTRKNSKWTMIN